MMGIQRKAQHAAGFTLIELMVVLVIMGVLFAFALPAYRDYVDTAEEATLRTNMGTIEMFQEDNFIRTGRCRKRLHRNSRA